MTPGVYQYSVQIPREFAYKIDQIPYQQLTNTNYYLSTPSQDLDEHSGFCYLFHSNNVIYIELFEYKNCRIDMFMVYKGGMRVGDEGIPITTVTIS